ncbi:MAG: hypothetical protein JNM80_04630 [Phycisphaerae bacterium]|nr:hypothetical protein [Phycisphaerae bacterium]
MTPGLVAIVVGALVLSDFVIVPLVIRALVNGSFVPLAKRYPPREPLPTAIRRGFQSFSIGVLNLGWCIHVTADAAHLHLSPTWLARRFGLTPVSLPWEALGPARVGRFSTAVRIPEIPGLVLRGPRWCLDQGRRPEAGADGATGSLARADRSAP